MAKVEDTAAFEQPTHAVNITLYDATGSVLDPTAREEFEEAATRVAKAYPNALINVTVV